MHLHSHQIFWFDFAGIGLVNLLLAGAVAVSIILITECRLFREYDPDLKLMLSRDGKLEYINKSAVSFFKLGNVDPGKRSEKINSWLDSCVKDRFEKAFEKFEYKEQKRSILFTKVLERKNRRILIFGTDISDQKTNEAEIHMLLAGMEQSANAVVITDLDARIIYVNRSFEKMTGYKKSEVIGKNPSVMKSGHHTVKFYDELWDTVTNGNTWHGTFLNKKKNGELYWEDATITPVIDDNIELYAFIAIKEDITARIELEKELRLAKTEAEKANDLKNEFLSVISHEIRTPLNVILGFTDILKIDEKDEGRIEKLGLIRKSGENLLNLVNKILDLSKLEAEKMTIDTEVYSLDAMLQEFERLFSAITRENNLDLVFNTSAEIPQYFNTGKNQIRHIIENLLGNAIKFTDEGYVRVTSSYGDGTLTIKVEDSGIGISEEIQQKIFESFQQGAAAKNRKYEGTGLGLTIADRLAVLLGGKITVESEIGKGSTFTFSMPILPVDIPGAINEALVLPVNGGPATLIEPAVQADQRFSYDLSSLSGAELDSLTDVLPELEGITAESNFDGLIEIAEQISRISEKAILAKIASDLRLIWELIDLPALEAFTVSLQKMSEGLHHG